LEGQNHYKRREGNGEERKGKEGMLKMSFNSTSLFGGNKINLFEG
jgi:hypothetical protein